MTLNRHQAAVRTQDIPNGRLVKCTTWEEAIDIYTQAYKDHMLVVLPKIGGIFDKPDFLGEELDGALAEDFGFDSEDYVHDDNLSEVMSHLAM
jgi:hypothetical protein